MPGIFHSDIWSCIVPKCTVTTQVILGMTCHEIRRLVKKQKSFDTYYRLLFHRSKYQEISLLFSHRGAPRYLHWYDLTVKLGNITIEHDNNCDVIYRNGVPHAGLYRVGYDRQYRFWTCDATSNIPRVLSILRELRARYENPRNARRSGHSFIIDYLDIVQSRHPNHFLNRERKPRKQIKK